MQWFSSLDHILFILKIFTHYGTSIYIAVDEFRWSGSFTIYPSKLDKGVNTGICGLFDDNAANDKRTGTATSDDSFIRQFK